MFNEKKKIHLVHNNYKFYKKIHRYNQCICMYLAVYVLLTKTYEFMGHFNLVYLA